MPIAKDFHDAFACRRLLTCLLSSESFLTEVFLGLCISALVPTRFARGLHGQLGPINLQNPVNLQNSVTTKPGTTDGWCRVESFKLVAGRITQQTPQQVLPRKPLQP